MNKLETKVERMFDWAVAGALAFATIAGIAGYITGRNSVVFPVPKNMENRLIFPNNVGEDVYTDIDFDGNIDIREQVVSGPNGFTKLYFKKGYNLGRSVQEQVEYVEPSYFDEINKTFYNEIVNFAYGRNR